MLLNSLSTRRGSLHNHAREAKLPEANIRIVMDVFDKVAKTLPEGKVRLLTPKEFEIKKSVSDEAHKKVLSELESMIKKA